MINHTNALRNLSTNRLRVGLVTPVQSLDPRESTDFVNVCVLWQIFETPYEPTFGEQSPKPLLLKEPLQSEPEIGGRKAYSAAIREGVKFSDGTPMTAQHVANSLTQNKSFSKLANVNTRGNRIFFILKRPHSKFEWTLTWFQRAVFLEKQGAIYGTGAYVPAPDATPERMRLIRNPHYREEVAIPEIEFLVFPREKDGRAEKLRKAIADGEVDFTTFLQRDEIRDLTSVRKCIELGMSVAMLYFNAERPIFRDPKIRKAIALAIDRKAIARLFYSNPVAYAASGILPPLMDRMPDGIVHDPDKAKSLMAESSLAIPNTPLRLMTIWGPRPYLPNPRQAAGLIAQQMGKLGFKVDIDPANSLSDYFDRTSRGDYDMVLAGWIPDTPDPADFLEVLLASGSIPDANVSVISRINLSRWKNVSMDEALKRYREEASEQSKTEIVRLLSEEMPLLPLMYGPAVVVHTWRLKNYPASFVSHPFFSTMKLGK